MKIFSRFKTLRSKITVIFGAMLIFSAIIISLASIIYFSTVSRQSLISSLEMAANNNTANASDFFRRIDLSVQMLTSEPSYFPTLVLDDEPDFVKKVNNYNTLRQFLKDNMNITLTESIPYYRMIYFADTDIPIYDILPKANIQELYTKNDYNPYTSIYKSESVTEEEWYKKTLDSDGEFYWFTSPEDDNMICGTKRLTIEFVNGDVIHYKHIGVIFISFDVSWISDRITTTKLTNRSSILLFSNNTSAESKSVVYSNNSDMTFSDINSFFSNNNLSASSVVMTKTHFMNEPVFLHTQPLDAGLDMLTIIPTKDIDNMVEVYIYVIIIIALIVIITISFAVVHISKIICSPINALSVHMQNNRNFDMISCENMNEDEIGMMYKSYNDLIVQLRNSAEKEKKATLNMLQAQINPHFIYNSLDSVCCMLLIKGESASAQVLSDLAEIMRYNTKNPNSMVPISSEIKQIENYMSLQKLKFADRISISYNIDKSCTDFLIPKMIIQPLVENCVNHAFNYISGNTLCIEIGIYPGENSVEIYVKDNGKCENTDEINKHINGIIQISKGTGGLGLRNVYERIQMNFGKGADLTYSSDSDGCTKAVIHIPKK